ncbi:tol-pal system-associated acyl-CoA thioesterase [Chachezhania antarctica]|uniref:tol-pal system-associated acyl-CoA thioesterase n=1 Tax=Chachezhania antarctica TaxID=2340860 RepID=UPI000EAF961C|nr:tol-pal system-associated acyl-CoA thioesterase [Chachezhania antarctica]
MTHRFPVQVYYEDTDMAGIVYHANYLRYIERGRSDWVRELGLDQNAMREKGLVFVVRRIEADYLAPARFEDRLEVVTELASLTRVKMGLTQTVYRGETALFRAQVTVVCMTQAGRPVGLPAEICALRA